MVITLSVWLRPSGTTRLKIELPPQITQKSARNRSKGLNSLENIFVWHYARLWCLHSEDLRLDLSSPDIHSPDIPHLPNGTGRGKLFLFSHDSTDSNDTDPPTPLPVSTAFFFIFASKR